MAILIAPERFRDFRIVELRWRLRRTERRQHLLLGGILFSGKISLKNRSIYLMIIMNTLYWYERNLGLYISPVNQPAAVRLSGAHRQVAVRTPDRRPVAGVNGQCPPGRGAVACRIWWLPACRLNATCIFKKSLALLFELICLTKFKLPEVGNLSD